MNLDDLNELLDEVGDLRTYIMGTRAAVADALDELEYGQGLVSVGVREGRVTKILLDRTILFVVAESAPPSWDDQLFKIDWKQMCFGQGLFSSEFERKMQDQQWQVMCQGAVTARTKNAQL